MFSKKDFNERLKILRKERGYTQETISKILKIKRNTYARYETSTYPPYSVLCDICKLLGCTTDYMLITPEAEETDE
jgi:transcriptional regulator with XRE-family HTH domain